MRNRWAYFRPVCEYLGLLIWAAGRLMLVPLATRAVFADDGDDVPAYAYWIPAVVAIAAGVALKRNLKFPPLDNRRGAATKQMLSEAWAVYNQAEERK